jgi:hypothetical protein
MVPTLHRVAHPHPRSAVPDEGPRRIVVQTLQERPPMVGRPLRQRFHPPLLVGQEARVAVLEADGDHVAPESGGGGGVAVITTPVTVLLPLLPLSFLTSSLSLLMSLLLPDPQFV